MKRLNLLLIYSSTGLELNKGDHRIQRDRPYLMKLPYLQYSQKKRVQATTIEIAETTVKTIPPTHKACQKAVSIPMKVPANAIPPIMRRTVRGSGCSA